MTIKKHILIEGKKSVNGLEVSRDLGRMNWHEAKIACKKLGTGWRLPTKDELNMLYENREEIVRISDKISSLNLSDIDPLIKLLKRIEVSLND